LDDRSSFMFASFPYLHKSRSTDLAIISP
jgi:hypothetical protein